MFPEPPAGVPGFAGKAGGWWLEAAGLPSHHQAAITARSIAPHHRPPVCTTQGRYNLGQVQSEAGIGMGRYRLGQV